MQCLEARCDVEYQRVIQLCNGRSDTRLGCGKRFQPGEDGLTGYCRQYQRNYQSAIFAVCRDRALAGSRTSHVETSIQVGIWSVVGRSVASDSYVIGTRFGCFSGVRCATSAAKCKTPSSSALDDERDSIASGAWRTRGTTGRCGTSAARWNQVGREMWRPVRRQNVEEAVPEQRPNKQQHQTSQYTAARHIKFQCHRVERW